MSFVNRIPTDLRQRDCGLLFPNLQRSFYGLAVVFCLFVHSGCGDSQQQTRQSAANRQPENAEEHSINSSNGSEQLSGSIPAQPTGSPVGTVQNESNLNPSADSGLTESANGTQVDSSVSAVPGATTATSLRPVKQETKPTQAQLDRWNRKEFEPLRLLACRESQATGFVSNLAAAKDGTHYLLAGTKITLWSLGTEVPEHVLLELTENQSIKSLAVAPNGEWFAAGDNEGTLRVWNMSDRKELMSRKLYPTGIIQIAISPDSGELATISYSDEITIWSSDSIEEKSRFKVDTNGVKRIEYMTSELLVAAGESTSSWNVRTGQKKDTLSSGRYNFTTALSPDGRQFLFSDKESLQFWNVTDQKPEFWLNGSFASGELATFSTDGDFLATANGSSVRVWSIADRRLVQVMDAYGWPITGLSWLPATNMLVIASENGRIRIWGKAEDAADVQLSPLQASVAMPEQSSQEPATSDRLLQCCDLRTFPQLPDSTLRLSDAFSISCDTATSPDEAMLFYRYQFDKLKWREVDASVATPNTIRFVRDGFMVSASFYEGADSKTSISVSFAGNYDVRKAPRFDAAPVEMVFENEDTMIYRTKADLLQIETNLLGRMHEAGWTACSRLHSSHSETEDGRHMEFLQNGTELRVSIGRFPTDPASYTIQYSRFLTSNSIPIPQDSGFVEFDGSTQPYLVASTKMKLAEARQFYDTTLAAQNWLVRDYGRTLEDDHNWLSYVRGQQELTIGLHSLPTGKTLIRIGDELEKSSWQLEKPAAQPESDRNVVGIEAADFPILSQSTSVKFDAIGKVIEIAMGTLPLPEIADLYAKEILASGWKLDGSGIKSDDYVYLTFVKDKAEIALRARIAENTSIVNIQGDGILWSKPLPTGKKVISYETWLRINHHPAGLELIEQYQTEMRPIADAVRNAEKE